MIRLLTSLGIGELAISLIALLNICQQWGLSLRIGCSEQFRTLEHQVLQIVGQSCGLRRVVLRTRPHGYICLDTGFLLIDGEIHSQSVVKRIDAGFHHVARNGGVLVILCHDAGCEHHEENNKEKEFLFHDNCIKFELSRSGNVR